MYFQKEKIVEKKFNLSITTIIVIIIIFIIYFSINSNSYLKVHGMQNDEHQILDSVAVNTVVNSNNADNLISKDTSCQRILLAGDSMADGLLSPFTKYCESNGHKLFHAGWTSSTIIGWGYTNRLSELIKKYKPTYVIMALGSNELYTTDLKIREKLVNKISDEASEIKFIWVGPPHWKEDSGLDSLLIETLGNKKYFSSKKMFLSEPLKNKRAPDKRHPTPYAFGVWADSIVSWITNKSIYPIILEKQN